MKTFIDKLIQLADGLDHLGLKKDADILDQIISKAAVGDEFEDYLKLFDEPVSLDVEEDKGPSAEKIVVEEPEVHTPLEEEEAPLSREKTGPSRLDMLKRRHELLKLKNKIKKMEKEEATPEETFEDEVKLPVATPADLETEEDEDIAVNEAEDGVPGATCEQCMMAPAAKDGLCKECIEDAEENERLMKEFESEPGFAEYVKKHEEEMAKLDAEQKAFEEAEMAKGKVKCKRCGDMVPPGRMHYPGNDPENDHAHKPDAEPDYEMANEADDNGLLEALTEKLKSVPELATKLLTIVKENPELLELLV